MDGSFPVSERAAAYTEVALKAEATRVAALESMNVATDAVDSVRSYFGMRKIHLGKIANETNLRPLLNNKFLFQMGMLDQGFWPDGIYTAPTDKALRWDFEITKQMGYNMLRKHIKVESDRWYYWADHMGVLVWQDMPCMYWEWDPKPNPSPAERKEYEREYARLVEEHVSFPSIVTYVVFNEGWGQYETERVTQLVSSWDTSRLYDPASGWVDADVGNLIDMHLYLGPGSPHPTATRAAVLGEFGGLGHKVDRHQWIPEDSFSYTLIDTREGLQAKYTELIKNVQGLMVNPEFTLSAAVYTELTDVEAEVNGQVTYDRQVVKINIEETKAVHEELIAMSQKLNDGAVELPEAQMQQSLAAFAASQEKPAEPHSSGLQALASKAAATVRSWFI
jgi:hypothetical protein